mgnify:CR=1 FL=1
MSFNKVMFSSASDHWSTPKDVYDALDKEFNFNDDPCPLGWVGASGLEREWGDRVFVNPPYSEIKKWVEYAYWQANDPLTKKKRVIVMLIPSRTDTRWFHDYVMKATEIRFIRGRLKFGGSKNSAPFPSAIVVFNNLKEVKGEIS